MQPSQNSDKKRSGVLLFKQLIRRLRQSSFARGAAGNLGARVAGAGLGFLSQILLARVLQASGYGVYIYALTWINLVAIGGAMGFTTASVRFVSEYRGQGKWKLFRGYLSYSRSTVLKASAFLAVAALGVALFLKQLGYASHISTFAIACFMLPVMTQVKIRAAELRGLKWVVWSQLPEKMIRLVVLILGVLFLAYGSNISVSAPWAMGVHLLGWVAGLTLVFLIAKRAFPCEATHGASEGRSEEWLSTSRDMMLIAGFNLVLFQADTIMVGALAGTTDAGLYAVASKLASLMIFVLLAVNSILGPVAAELQAQGKTVQLQRIVTFATWGIFIPSVLVGVGLLYFDVQALGVFGEEFVQSDDALKLLIGGQLVNAMAGPANLLLNMTGHQRMSAKILGGSAVLNIVLNATLIPLFGFVGAALATAITMLVWNSLAVWMVWRVLKIVAFTLPWQPYTQ